jgi:hypothetical protein
MEHVEASLLPMNNVGGLNEVKDGGDTCLSGDNIIEM